MSTEQYWNSDPYLAQYYREAHRMRIKQRNEEMWLQGLYIYNAFGTVLANAFAAKGAKKQRYLEKPIDILPKTEAEKVAEAEEERAKIVSNLTAWKAAWDRKNNKQGEKHDDRKP